MNYLRRREDEEGAVPLYTNQSLAQYVQTAPQQIAPQQTAAFQQRMQSPYAQHLTGLPLGNYATQAPWEIMGYTPRPYEMPAAIPNAFNNLISRYDSLVDRLLNRIGQVESMADAPGVYGGRRKAYGMELGSLYNTLGNLTHSMSGALPSMSEQFLRSYIANPQIANMLATGLLTQTGVQSGLGQNLEAFKNMQAKDNPITSQAVRDFYKKYGVGAEGPTGKGESKKQNTGLGISFAPQVTNALQNTALGSMFGIPNDYSDPIQEYMNLLRKEYGG